MASSKLNLRGEQSKPTNQTSLLIGVIVGVCLLCLLLLLLLLLLRKWRKSGKKDAFTKWSEVYEDKSAFRLDASRKGSSLSTPSAHTSRSKSTGNVAVDATASNAKLKPAECSSEFDAVGSGPNHIQQSAHNFEVINSDSISTQHVISKPRYSKLPNSKKYDSTEFNQSTLGSNPLRIRSKSNRKTHQERSLGTVRLHSNSPSVHTSTPRTLSAVLLESNASSSSTPPSQLPDIGFNHDDVPTSNNERSFSESNPLHSVIGKKVASKRTLKAFYESNTLRSQELI